MIWYIQIIFVTITDKWKVIMVDCGCVPLLLSVKDAQYKHKFIDLVVLMLMESMCLLCS